MFATNETLFYKVNCDFIVGVVLSMNYDQLLFYRESILSDVA